MIDGAICLDQNLWVITTLKRKLYIKVIHYLDDFSLIQIFSLIHLSEVELDKLAAKISKLNRCLLITPTKQYKT